MRKIIGLLIIIFLVTVCSTASGFFCQNKIKSGDSSYKVMERCGEPDSKKVIGYTSETEGRRKYVIEEWIYNDGIYRYIVTMAGDEVTYIKQEER